MRGIFAIAIGIVAGLMLAACSSSGSPTLPGASQAVTSGAHTALHLVLVGVRPEASCPSQFFQCVTISRTKHARVSVCVEQNSSCPAPGSWTWSEAIQTLAGKPVHKIIGDISPNPGNPITDKISEKRAVKSSKGEAKYQQIIEACSYSSCIQGAIGIITK